MNDLISRQDAIAVADYSDYAGLSVDDVKKVTDEVVKGLRRLPSAQPVDVVEVVRGEWIDKGEDYMIRWTCSNCGRRDTHIYNFYPDCGADMRGGTE